MDLKKIRKLFDAKVVTRDYIRKELKDLKNKRDKATNKLKKQQKALSFIEDIAIKTQSQLSENLQDCISAGLNSVFDIPYRFKIDFVLNRGRPQCDMAFLKNGRLVDPMNFSGGGEVDVAAFSARVACLSMAPRYRKILILDEPFIRLKGEAENKRVIKLMGELSHRLGIQIITVSDERAPREDIIEGADRVFWIDQKNNRSKIKILK